MIIRAKGTVSNSFDWASDDPIGDWREVVQNTLRQKAQAAARWPIVTARKIIRGLNDESEGHDRVSHRGIEWHRSRHCEDIDRGGAKVAITGRDEKRLAAAGKAIGAHPIPQTWQGGGRPSHYKELFQTFATRHLVNNAVFGVIKPSSRWISPL